MDISTVKFDKCRTFQFCDIPLSCDVKIFSLSLYRKRDTQHQQPKEKNEKIYQFFFFNHLAFLIKQNQIEHVLHHQ